MIELNDIWHRYGRTSRWVLTGINLSIHAGEFWAITGPSGRGKSTLLWIVGGLLVPTQGTRTVEPDCHPSFVLQQNPLLRRRSALDNVALPFVVRGDPYHVAQQRAEALLSTFGLSQCAGRRGRFLSGGEQQRVCIARAAACGSALLVCDEPTGQLDNANSRSVAEALLVLARTGTAIVAATHDPVVVEQASHVLDLGADS